MSDRRRHRGPHPEDQQLFAAAALPGLQTAVAELSWLWSRGYAETSSLKLVGDRHRLTARQRVAVARAACSDAQRSRRQRHCISVEALAGQELWIDGFNVLTSVEAALAGGVILQARDGTYRDMASMHGNYRKIAETLPAIQRIISWLATHRLRNCHWLLDQPVSNSGRLKTILSEIIKQHGWEWTVELVGDPDAALIRSGQIVASADSQILDRADRWFNLARAVIEAQRGDVWFIDLTDPQQR